MRTPPGPGWTIGRSRTHRSRSSKRPATSRLRQRWWTMRAYKRTRYYGAATETLKFGGPAPAFAGSSNWGLTVVLPSFQRVLLGEIKPEEAVDVMMKGLDKAVKG